MKCVFMVDGQPCPNSANDGVCEEHRDDAYAILAGDSPRCAHGPLWSEACDRCGRESAVRRLKDANAVDAVQQGRFEADLRRADAALRLLRVELSRVDIEAKLGPNGGDPVATHLWLVGGEGRGYHVDVEDVKGDDRLTMCIRWGNRLAVRAAGVHTEVVGAVVTYLRGAKSRR